MFPSIKPIHGSNSKTFTMPPLDGSLTIPELSDWHAEHSPDHLLFVHASSPGEKIGITFKQGAEGIHRAGRLLTERLTKLGVSPLDEDGPVVALLATSGKCQYTLYSIRH
jgi:hypothetical protein